MELQVIIDAIVPNNIKEIPLVSVCTKIFVEMLNRNSTISQRIRNLYNTDYEVSYQYDDDGNLVEIKDSAFLKRTKNNLKEGLFLTYLNVLYTMIEQAQLDPRINEAIKLRNYQESIIYKDAYDIITNEYLGSFRFVQQNIGTENAIKYIYQFSKYLECGYLRNDLDIHTLENSNFILNYQGSLHKFFFTNFMKSIAHPCSWIYNYTTFLEFILNDTFGIKFTYHLPRIVIKTRNKFIFFTTLTEQEFKDNLEKYARAKDFKDKEHSMWCESVLYYDEEVDNSRFNFVDICKLKFLELDDMPLEMLMNGDVDNLLKEYDVLLVHYDFVRYDYFLSDQEDEKHTLITLKNKNDKQYYIAFDNKNVYYYDRLDSSYDIYPNTDYAYKFNNFYELDCGSTSEINDNRTYEFLYTDEISFDLEIELTKVDTFYLGNTIKNAFHLYGEPYKFIVGYDESKNKIVNYEEVLETQNNYNLTLKMYCPYTTYLRIYTQKEEHYIETLEPSNNVITLNTLGWRGKDLNVDFLDPNNEKVYIKTNLLNYMRKDVYITELNHTRDRKLTIRGFSDKSRNLKVNGKSYKVSSDFEININNIEEVISASLEDINIETNICCSIEDVDFHIFTYDNTRNIVTPTTKKITEVNDNAQGKTLYELSKTNKDTWIDANSEFSKVGISNVLEGENYDKVFEKDFNENLTFVNLGFEHVPSTTSEMFVMDSTKYVNEEFDIQFIADNYFLLFTDDRREVDVYLITKEHDFDKETVIRGTEDIPSHYLTFKKEWFNALPKIRQS